jgi:hypothetical protein
MNPQQIQNWISIISLIVQSGGVVAGQAKALLTLFHPLSTLTEEQINAIEQAGIADSQRRQQERIAMGQASE